MKQIVMESHAPNHVLLIRPAAFGSNPETLQSNAFQQEQDLPADQIHARAVKEFDAMVAVLTAHDISTLVVEDTKAPSKPDAIFPNNWLSLQPDGTLAMYPMLAANRRLERRQDIVTLLKEKFEVVNVMDFSSYEERDQIVEGTGSIVFDHTNKIGYAARSPRTHDALVIKICDQLGYTPLLFDALDQSGEAIYHTNVMLAVTTDFAVVCLDSIRNESDQDLLLNSFNTTGHKVISISFDQMRSFAGNVLEVTKKNQERVLVISEAAVHSLLPGQLDAITKFVDVLPISIPTIEKYSGGSVRCMMAGIHVTKKE